MGEIHVTLIPKETVLRLLKDTNSSNSLIARKMRAIIVNFVMDLQAFVGIVKKGKINVKKTAEKAKKNAVLVTKLPELQIVPDCENVKNGTMEIEKKQLLNIILAAPCTQR